MQVIFDLCYSLEQLHFCPKYAIKGAFALEGLVSGGWGLCPVFLINPDTVILAHAISNL